MREIVLDERAWAENMLRNLDMGKKPASTVACLARYYYAEGYSKKEIQEKLREFIMKCNPDTLIHKWDPFIERVTKNAGKHSLISLDGVSVSKTEMQRIAELPQKMHRKLMFTLLCLAKYGNSVNEKNSNWVNLPTSDIFALSNNAKMSSKRQALMINDLWTAGYIGYSNLVDNLNLNVKIIDDGEQELFVSDFRNLGNQYLQHTEGGYMQCENCGLCIRATKNRKYCDICGVEVNRAKSRDSYIPKTA